MKKVYLVIEEREYPGSTTKYTNIVHICTDEDLAVEYANSYINDVIHDSLREEHTGFVWVERQEQSVGKYYSKDELYRGGCYLAYGSHETDSIIESYSIKIEEHEVKED
ncbi:MAG: hypothetical protein J6Y02_21005 [Pseudobutyrivibrio sp.]|nr:hypothetical protein [Pseudobutyrivibrio sp.]